MWAGFRETSGGWCNILELVTPGNCYTFRPEDLGEWPVPACQRELWLFGTASWHKLWPVKEGSSQPAMIWLANKDSEQSISYCPCPSTPASSSHWPNPTRSERQTVLMKPINAVYKSQLSEAQSRVKGGEWIWRGKWKHLAQHLDVACLLPYLPGISVHGDSPGKNTGVDCHALFQEIFPTLGSNPGLLHCR